MLIATLPSVDDFDALNFMLRQPEIDGARYNTGMRGFGTPDRVIAIIKAVADTYKKKIWIDLKGRQLRIAKWADPEYGTIELNREIEIDIDPRHPPTILFRGDRTPYSLAHAEGSTIYITPSPRQALGNGQAVNILSDSLIVKGNYLTERDVAYINAASERGVHDFMLSYVERFDDIREVQSIDPLAVSWMKIENQKGLNFINQLYIDDRPLHAIAARDDLMTNFGSEKFKIIQALQDIRQTDPEAIVASHIFRSLANHTVSATDFTDIEFLRRMGYHHYMLDDTISHYHLDDALALWRQCYMFK